MISAVLIRVVRSIVAILIVVTLVFVVVRLTGDPIRSVLPENTPEDIVQQYRIKWGLNGSLWQQYVDYIKGLLHGDFGRSYFDDTGALNAVVTRVPATLELAVPAFVLSTVAGLGLGITAAVRKGSALDRIISSGSIAMAALPGFLLGVVLMLIFGVKLHWLPTAGNNGLDHLVLPVITMAGTTAGVLARITRTSMIEALALPCLAHARALHVRRRRRTFAHALPNAALPLITVLGFELAYLVAGSSIVEVLFSWPGVGRLFVQASERNDFAVVQCIVVLVTVSVVIVYALTDVLYRVVDPRLRRTR